MVGVVVVGLWFSDQCLVTGGEGVLLDLRRG